MSFLTNFMTWNEGTEVPENYYFWSGVSALAACVNGRVWIPQGKFTHFPNMYIVLLGPPANGKTTAIRRAERVVREVGDITLSAQSETAEGLLRFMRDKCVKTLDLPPPVGVVPYTPLSLYLSELSNFFGKDPAGMIDMMTGIWDCGGEEYHRRTKGQGEDMLPRPNVNLIAGTTQDWITQYLKVDIVGGGFTRRVIFVNEGQSDDTFRVAWPEDTPEKMRAKESCVAYGRVLQNLKGEMKYGPGAKDFYMQWYNTRPIPKEADVRGYHKTKPANLLKVGTLVALSERPELVVETRHLEIALALLDKTEGTLTRVFQAIGRNELNAIAHRIIELLYNSETKPFLDNTDGQKKVAKFVPMKVIQATFYKDIPSSTPSKQLDDVMLHLQQTEKIFYYDVTSPSSGRIVRLVGLKESISLVPGGDSTKEKK